jgi:6-phosphogluconolactonase
MNKAESDHTPGRKILVATDAEAVAKMACDWFIERCGEAIARKGVCWVALSGGSTPKRLYELLAELPAGLIDWSKVVLCWGDERNVAADHADSNYRMVKLSLLDKLNSSTPTVHRIRCGELSPEDACEAYERLLRSHANDGYLRFDIVLLGLGDDAHTASLFPETSALTASGRWVVSNEVSKLKTTRVTMTAELINAGHDVAFLVCGANKRWALDKIFGHERNPNLYPAQLVAPSGRLWWFLDEAANQR